MQSNPEIRLPRVREAAISLVTLIISIGVSVGVFGLYPQVPLLMGLVVACIVAWRCGYNWDAIEQGMINGVTRSIPAIMIFILIGMMIGIWIIAGVVPTMLFYGLKVLSPEIFLPSALIICAITSVATGSSWGTSGTIGVAMVGIGSGLGLPLPVVAGAVISGAYFGDKMSPLSDTTNLASSMAGANLYAHIRHMTNTTSIAFGITLVIEILLGLKYSSAIGNNNNIAELTSLLETTFVINPMMLIPPILLIIVSIKKVPPLPGLAVGILSAVGLGFIIQDASFAQTMKTAFSGYNATTGVETFDNLLSRGGIESMYFTITLVIIAMMFGGVMEHTNQLKVLVIQLVDRATTTGSLVASTVFTTIAANLVLCEQYMSIIVGARAYAEEYEKRGLHAKNLSRVLEDSGTVTANLIPWTSGGAYQAGVLGVATFAYAPFAFFCWISPLVTLAFGYLNINMTKIEDDPTTQLSVKSTL
ncbi:MAG: NhaC family Na+:H+ antiporter [Porticoccus sp.]|jgi:NhaC family Na+:H+ antiporter